MPEPDNTMVQTITQLIRFVIVGGVAALLYVAFASILKTQAGVPTWIASVVSYTSMIIPAYFGQRQFVFRTGIGHRAAMPRYFAVQALCAGLSALLALWLESLAGVAPVIVFVCVAAVLAVFSFAMSRLWVFAVKAPKLSTKVWPQ